MTVAEQYILSFDKHLKQIAESLEKFLRSMLDQEIHIDSITARAKDPDRFLKKAAKLSVNGESKYDDPLNQIQDQIGARITVLYLKDVENISQSILKYLVPIEIKEKKPDNDAEFGYFGEHFILKIPDDVIPDNPQTTIPEFFELQIKTLFQHAWSEAHHDLGYKSMRPLTALESRKIAFTAAQGWGADRIFQELADDLVFATSSQDNDQDAKAAY